MCCWASGTSVNVRRSSNEGAVVIQRMRHKFQTITFANGTEFHDYERLERRFGVTCYFATPYHSWERGSTENLNGLVRRYVPRGRSLKRTTQEDCDKIAAALNNRPRKRQRKSRHHGRHQRRRNYPDKRPQPARAALQGRPRLPQGG